MQETGEAAPVLRIHRHTHLLCCTSVLYHDTYFYNVYIQHTPAHVPALKAAQPRTEEDDAKVFVVREAGEVSVPVSVVISCSLVPSIDLLAICICNLYLP